MLHLLDASPALRDGVVRKLRDTTRDQHRLDYLAKLVDLLELACLELHHARAGVRDERDEPLVMQLPQRLAHG